MPSRKSKHKFGMALTAEEGTDNVNIIGRLWIEKSGETAFSWSRAMLLDGIEKHGSISAAARSMKMSYPKAWRLVKEMNERFNVPLVIKKSGGKGGGEAELTDAGRKVRDRFWKLVDGFTKWLEKQNFEEDL